MIDRILGMLLGAAFFLAGWLKWLEVAVFEKAIRSMNLVPPWLGAGLAVWLPPFEMICGALLVLGFWKRPALLGCSLMGVMFVVALSWGLARGTVGSCGCFGAWDPLANRPALSLVRAALFLGMAVVLYWRALGADVK